MRPNTLPKKVTPLDDWHPADIVCALRKRGWSLRRLSLHHGYANPATLKNATQRPWPKGERLIAAAIGVPAREIWPSRFAERARRAKQARRDAA
jgi:Ner family transcriptional regulator